MTIRAKAKRGEVPTRRLQVANHAGHGVRSQSLRIATPVSLTWLNPILPTQFNPSQNSFTLRQGGKSIVPRKEKYNIGGCSLFLLTMVFTKTKHRPVIDQQ